MNRVILSLASLVLFANIAISADLVRSYDLNAPTIIHVSPYERPVPSLEDAMESLILGKPSKPKMFRALYRGGSGIIVRKDGVIITAAHVVKGSPLARIETHSGAVYRAAVLSYDAEHDLALLKLLNPPRERLKAVRIGDDKPMGYQVYTLGHPYTMRWAITTGILSTIDEERYISDALVDFGSSGGGLFDAETDKLMGVVVQLHKGYSASILNGDLKAFMARTLPLTNF